MLAHDPFRHEDLLPVVQRVVWARMASSVPEIAYRPHVPEQSMSRRSPVLGSTLAGFPQIGQVVGVG
jgi:hypothetical protein